MHALYACLCFVNRTLQIFRSPADRWTNQFFTRGIFLCFQIEFWRFQLDSKAQCTPLLFVIKQIWYQFIKFRFIFKQSDGWLTWRCAIQIQTHLQSSLPFYYLCNSITSCTQCMQNLMASVDSASSMGPMIKENYSIPFAHLSAEQSNQVS